MAALPVDALRVLPPRTLVRLQGVAQRRGRPRAHLLPPSVRGLLLNYIVDHCAGLVLCDIEWWSPATRATVDSAGASSFQPLVSSTFLSEQICHQQPASSNFLSEQISTSPRH
jgi:hypothetical protein